MKNFNIPVLTEIIDGERSPLPCITYLCVLVLIYGTKLTFIQTENLSKMCTHTYLSF